MEAVNAEQGRRMVSGRGGAWSGVEVEALFDGIRVHGEGNWTSILMDVRFNAVLRRRTSCDLKDKWRSCCRRARAAQEKGEAPLPLPVCVTKALSSSAHLPGAKPKRRRARSKSQQANGQQQKTAGAVRRGADKTHSGAGGARLGKPPQRKLSSGHGGPWAADEVEALVAGVRVHGEGSWRAILDDTRFAGVLRNRTNADLKDKWRVVCKRSKARSSLSATRPPEPLVATRILPPMQDVVAAAVAAAAAAMPEAGAEVFMDDSYPFPVVEDVEDGTLLDTSLPLGNEGAACALVKRIDPPSPPPRTGSISPSAASALSVDAEHRGDGSVKPMGVHGLIMTDSACGGSGGSDLWVWGYESSALQSSVGLVNEPAMYEDEPGFGRTGSTNLLTTQA